VGESPILYMCEASLQWPVRRRKMTVCVPRPRSFSPSSPDPAWPSLHFSQKWLFMIVFAWEKERGLDGWSMVETFFASPSALSFPESPQWAGSHWTVTCIFCDRHERRLRVFLSRDSFWDCSLCMINVIMITVIYNWNCFNPISRDWVQITDINVLQINKNDQIWEQIISKEDWKSTTRYGSWMTCRLSKEIHL